MTQNPQGVIRDCARNDRWSAKEWKRDRQERVTSFFNRNVDNQSAAFEIAKCKADRLANIIRVQVRVELSPDVDDSRSEAAKQRVQSEKRHANRCVIGAKIAGTQLQGVACAQLDPTELQAAPTLLGLGRTHA